MTAAILVMTALGLLFGFGLGWAARRFRVESDPVADRIDKLLPQTQCGQCNYPGCRPYAAAIAAGEAPINLCPPGGEATVRALADLLGTEVLPLDPEHAQARVPTVAVIDEAACIGCTLCIQACPVDAIIGAPKLMHTVIAGECTGCDLCLPPCPVDCIEMVPRPALPGEWARPRPDGAGPPAEQAA